MAHKLEISLDKSNYVVFSKLSKNRNPTVRYRGSPIRRVDSTKYLGVVQDERLSFTKHVEYNASKGRNIFQALRKYASQNWGKSEVWIEKAASHNNRRKLRNLQCACLRAVIGAYKTTPCETVCVIAKRPPLELEIRRRLAYSKLRRHGQTRLLGEEVRLQDYGLWVAAALQIRAIIVGACQRMTKKGSHTNCLELWNQNGTGIIFLRALFSYKRFKFLLRALRFDNLHSREERKQSDKLAPIRNFHDNFVNNCMAHFKVSEFYTIDEMLHAFKGRCSFVRYIPNKPAKYGIKIYALSDAKTFYTFNLEIYCGKQVPGPYLKSNKAKDIVKRLVVPIEKSKRNVTTDNYYTSYPLAIYLLTKKLTLLGTLKKI
ncbi:hypothetical protein JTB14_029109 [Gonioctena quinquepunctata]|nr:hypothetical protein JTB14_029109 [Gonioctena quinquepunctata]